MKIHKLLNAKEWNIYEESINGFGCIVKEYTKKHYDKMIHLPVEFPFDPDGHRPTSELFRQQSEILLKNTYKELGLTVFEAKGNLENRLTQIISYLELNPVISVKEAIERANKMKKDKFDSIKIEKAKNKKHVMRMS